MQLPTIDHDQLPPGVTLTRAAPRNPRARFADPEWDVWLDGTKIGHIEQWTVRSCSTVFYQATGIHPATGAGVRLESDPDFMGRVELIAMAWRHPDRYPRHG